MNYELAKKLKDAGFPQDLDKKEIKGVFGNSLGYYYLGKYGKVYKPLLSELIEACRKFKTKMPGKYFQLQTCDNDTNWIVVIDSLFTGKGKTPEEAVANLWLELNKK